MLLLACIAGYTYMTQQIVAQQHLRLPPSLEGEPLTVTGTITSVVEDTSTDTQKFIFDIKQPSELARTVRVSWYRPRVKLQAGDTWQLRLKLRQARDLVNPAGFDREKYYFMQRIAALGRVVPNNDNNKLISTTWNIHRLRQYMFARIGASGEYGGIVGALLLGIKQGITQEQREVLQNTGTAHLMAISGMHLGFICNISILLCWFIWRRLLATRTSISAPNFVAVVGLLVSTVYAALSGFAIPTQRALIMLSIWLGGSILYGKINRINSYCIALIAVLLLDPFAVLSIGFWLSFGAVGCLLYAFTAPRQGNIFTLWLRAQFVLLLGLLPISCLFFQQSSQVGFFANMLAIPWIGYAVLPFCFCGLHSVAEYSLQLLWPILEYFNNFQVYNWSLPTNYLYLRIGCALFGFLWLFAPKGIPGRAWGCFGFAPLFLYMPLQIPYRQADFTLLDVGQGMAAVVRTAQHTLVYDVGNVGMGRQVVVPFVRSLGVKKIDSLVISHSDQDHSGGVHEVLQAYPNTEILTSAGNKFPTAMPCKAGQHWEWDGVFFTMLHPSGVYRKSNDKSCVLLVEANNQRVLLTGDIEALSERQLIASSAINAEVLIVPHHGSKTSSTTKFIEAVNPLLALIPVGYQNMYGHPKAEIINRYMERGIPIFASDRDGAIRLRLGESLASLIPKTYRSGSRREFWRIQS